jgi:APA family basic amino acid/polyamine antiporter
VVITEFAAILFPESTAWGRPLAIIATSLIGLIIFALALVLFFVGAPVTPAADTLPVRNGIGDWSLVIATIIFTYDGWLYASYFSGETKGGAGTAASSCIKGMVVVIALYMLLNAALVKSTGLAALAGNELALAHALELVVSPAAGSIIIVASILILLSHQNLCYMGGPRILQALAEDGLAAQRAQKVGTGGNPVFAVMVTWLVTVALILIGGFEFLLLLSVFFYVPLYLALITGVLILRRREPHAERPYRAWGHPFSTIACLIGWIVITVFQAYAERETALYAVAMVAVSWPVYRYLARK